MAPSLGYAFKLQPYPPSNQIHMNCEASIKLLYNKYLNLIEEEVKYLGVKPTELRHLIGRLGEFHCALQVNGTLSHLANQHGFDVICKNERRISVKTTAQSSGFIAISKSTLDKVDDLMLIQYVDGKCVTVYYGPIDSTISHCRYYEGKYELEITKARKLMSSLKPATQV